MRQFRVVLLASVAACVGAAGATTQQPTAIDGVYLLARVGERRLETREQNRRSCSLRPYWGQLSLRSPVWVDAESLFINCDPNGAAQLHVRGDSGIFRRRAGDTLDFFAKEEGRDPTMPVFSAILRGSALRVIGSDEGEGDYVYLKR
jgi:hypothetical protein